MNSKAVYVDACPRKIDEKGRVDLPKHFNLNSGELIYCSSEGVEIRCFDNFQFTELSKKFKDREYSRYRVHRIDKNCRLYLGRQFGEIKGVNIEGRGKYFAIVPLNK